MVLIAAGFVTKSGDDEKGTSKAAATPLPDVKRIERRLEGIRELRFKRETPVRRVTGAQTRREGLAQLDRRYPVAQRRADEELLELLGLLKPGSDLRSISGSLFGDQVAGFYDTRTKKLAVVEDSSGGAPLVEITLAHELTHALEDQRFGLRDENTVGVEDGAAAYSALVEGSATSAMTEYARRYPGSVSLGDALSGALQGAGGTGLPPYIEASSLFPYLAGQRFVDELRRVGGWRLVNSAYTRPPSSTEQIIHPEKYLRVEQPDAVMLRLGLGPPWRRIGKGSVGEFDTRELLKLGDRKGANEAAAGWGGGAYELWRMGPLPDRACAAPCRRRDALVLAWKWDTARDAREFRRSLARYTRTLPSPVATATDDRGAALAIAPTAALARRLAGRGLAAASGSGF